MTWGLITVISGLQTGADQAGLFVAEHLGYSTGGFCPRGARTESGDRPDLRDRFGLTDAPSDDYAVRTLLNITHADGTVIFGHVESGSALTLRLAAVHQGYGRVLTNPTAAQIAQWIVAEQIATLNVAGNRLSKNPTIYNDVIEILQDALWRPGMRTDRLAPVVLAPAGRLRR